MCCTLQKHDYQISNWINMKTTTSDKPVLRYRLNFISFIPIKMVEITTTTETRMTKDHNSAISTDRIIQASFLMYIYTFKQNSTHQYSYMSQ